MLESDTESDKVSDTERQREQKQKSKKDKNTKSLIKTESIWRHIKTDL